ncbi:MAG: hypothetical protein K2J77_09965, partial [Oscillospiraceae bacterium]|nr:hypothetical protein [Oscillospiraceae bacterium]
MKYKRIAAIISAAAVGLALTGCGYKSESVPVIPQNQQNGQSSVTPPKPVESKIAESKPAASSPAADLPDIPVNDASAFEYSFNSALGGMVITGYKLSDTMVHIPETLDNEIVVEVNLKDVEKNITHLIMPDSVKKFSLSNATKRGLKYIYIPTGVT